MRGNRAADELRRLAIDIGTRGPASIGAFGCLLDEDRNNGVSGWAAFHILEVMTTSPEVADRAFAVIERIATVRVRRL